MKTIGLLLFTCSLNVYAQAFTYNYQVQCGPVLPLIQFLSETQQEKMTWMGSHISDGSVYSLWEDKDGNWTLLKKNTEIACIIGSGTKPKTT